MTLKHSIAARERMMRLSKEERSKRMSKLAKIKNQKMTKTEKRAHANMMVKARTK